MAGLPLNFELVRKQFTRYQKEIVRILKKYQTRPFAFTTDDAKELQFGQTAVSLMQPARTLLSNHVARLNNPHRETAASIGTLTAPVIMSLFNIRMPQGFLPLSHYGFVDIKTDVEIKALWSYNGFSLTVSAPVIAYLAGTMVTLPARSFNLASLYPSRSTNNTFDLAIRRRLNSVAYEIVEVGRAPIPIRPLDSNTYMYLGSITTGDLGITALNVERVMRIDGIRISNQPKGSSMPATSQALGTPNVKLPTGW